MRIDTGEERWDEQMFRLRNLEPAPLPPRRDQRLAMLHPDDRTRTLDAMADSYGKPQPQRYEFRVVLPDGSVRWLASRSIAVEDENGKVARRNRCELGHHRGEGGRAGAPAGRGGGTCQPGQVPVPVAHEP